MTTKKETEKRRADHHYNSTPETLEQQVGATQREREREKGGKHGASTQNDDNKELAKLKQTNQTGERKR